MDNEKRDLGSVRHPQARRWLRVRARVLTEAGLRLTPQLRDRAAQLEVTGSVLAGVSAARVWNLGLPDTGAPPQLLVTRRSEHRPPGVQVSRASNLCRGEVQIFEGALVTSRGRTIVDCLIVLPKPQALDLMDRALQKQWITVADLADWKRRFRGRRGVARLAELLKMATQGTRFAAERRTAQLLSTAGIVGWECNVAIHDDVGLIGVVDFVFREVMLVIEVDGWAFHVTPDRFQADRLRQNRLVAAGYVVLRFTWRDLVERPEYVITTIRNMLDRLSRALR